MKKTIYYIAAAVLTLGLTSCAKEAAQEHPINTEGARQISVWAQIDDEATTKTALSGNDAEGYTVLWSEGDEITVADGLNSTFTLVEGAGTSRGRFVGTSEAGDGTYDVFYAASVATNYKKLPGTSRYNGDKVISSAPMAATITISNGVATITDFKNLCGLLRLTLKGSGTVKEIKIYASQALYGNFDILPDGSAVITSSPYNDYITQTCENGVSLSRTGTDFYISLPPNDYTGVKIDVSDFAGHTFTKTLKAEKSLNIARAQITPVSFSVTGLQGIPDTQDAVLPGVFSVSSSKKVHFSKGNLMAVKNSGSDYSWGFALNQYDYVGNRAGNTTIDNQATGSIVDLFGFSSAKNYFGISTYQSTAGYSGDLIDWGNAIDSEGTWFTLSLNEWKYLFGNNTARKDKYGSATVCGVKGLLFVPDVFNDPMTNKGSEAFVPRSGNAAWNANVYSGNDWSAMEDAGAVFLPTAGYRLYDEDTHATMVGNVGSICFYWSSSIESTSYLLQGYIIEYGEDKDIKEYSKARFFGHSVRLVTKVNQ